MHNEFETKVLDIDSAVVISQLRELGAVEEPEFLARRYVFDMDINDTTVEWIRLRQQGSKAPTLTYKYKVKGNYSIGNTTEIEVEVSDFDKTSEILHKLQFKKIYYQENKSHIFTLDGIEFSIDTWPVLPPYLEIEGESVEKVQAGLLLLGFEGKDVGDKDVKIICQERGIDLHSYIELRF